MRGQVARDALRAQLGEQLAQRVAERHAGRNLAHQREVEPLRAELAAARRLAYALAPDELHVAARPADAVGGQKAELLRGDRQPFGVALPGETPFDLFEADRIDLARQAQRDFAQREVDGRVLRLAVVHVEPGTQRAVAFAQFERQRDVAAQLAHVGARHFGVDQAAPMPPVAAVAEQRLGEASARAETLAPRGRRRRVEAHLVAAQAVANDDLHVGERERRPVALLVGPAQRPAANDELSLPEEPVGGAVVLRVVRCAEVEPGDEQVALPVAPHFELRPVDQQLLEAHFEREQRARRQRSDDARQRERGAFLRIEKHDVVQLDGRHPATRANADRANLHRNTEHAARSSFDLGAPLRDVRQNPPVKCQPGEKQ